MDFHGKVILAPMVRVSTLPVRLLALEYGADIVFTEELVDWKLLSSVRQVNKALGTVDYVDPADGTVTLRTCAEERPRLVLQMGTCDPERALKVAQKYEKDVAGIDINMGCPKEFSIKGGMGAALLQQPEKVKNILTTLVNGVKIPVTCKIRLLATDDQTLAFCRMAESCGIAALTVHGRTRHERPRHPVHEDAIRRVAEALTIPVVANGGSRHIRCRAEAEQFRSRCGAAGVMLARAAMWNLSVFREQGPLEMDEVITRLLQLCVRYSHPFTQAKYTVQQMLRELQETPRGKQFLATQTLEEICALWGLGSECRAALGPPASPDSRPMSKRPRLEDDVVPGHRPFVRGHYKPEQLPKTLLHVWSAKHCLPLPDYRLQFSDKLFRAVCTVRGNKYASLWEKNKKFAEQGSALTCCVCLGITGLPPGVSAPPGDVPAGVSAGESAVSAVSKESAVSAEPKGVDTVSSGDPAVSTGGFQSSETTTVSAVCAVSNGQPLGRSDTSRTDQPECAAKTAVEDGKDSAESAIEAAEPQGQSETPRDTSDAVRGSSDAVREPSDAARGSSEAVQDSSEALRATVGCSAAVGGDSERKANGVPPEACQPVGGE